jgi:Arc/MetJ-type ribon-helix-helix transcriptional regulator
MTTISVPISSQLEESINNLIKNGYGGNKAEVVRKAIVKAAEDEAIAVVLRAMEEPSLAGDLKKLSKKFK